MSTDTQPVSTTRKTLLRLGAALLAATAVMGVATTISTHRLYRTVQTVQDRSVPAIVGVVDTRNSLIVAHEAAVRSFQSGEVHLAGPGVQYQDELASASRSMTRVAEDNVAGEEGSQKIQLVEGLLIAYLDLIGRADVHYRQDEALGSTYLWHAWRLLDGEILPALDELRLLERKAFDGQRSRSALATMAIGAVPVLALLALLPFGQRFVHHRFRRTFSLSLVIAMALLVAFAVAATLATVTATQRLAAVDESLAGTERHAAPTASGEWDLLALLGCEEPEVRCGQTIQLVHASRGSTSGQTASPAGPALADEAERERRAERERLTGEALGLASAWPATLVVSLAVGALILLGFAPRLEEYRYR